ncbi:hypothetical protein BpHYR1_032233 [Brachionus plicatilis]|uniref:Uncharacterized protein n=1 Tax=Brachionus plicatilis TaxID=10195 RepID=A0A3M7T9G2_BRAPC|nr:hypothetical protein BpHYR1_032233 [Brachionus plicatilis]
MRSLSFRLWLRLECRFWKSRRRLFGSYSSRFELDVRSSMDDLIEWQDWISFGVAGGSLRTVRNTLAFCTCHYFYNLSILIACYLIRLVYKSQKIGVFRPKVAFIRILDFINKGHVKSNRDNKLR